MGQPIGVDGARLLECGHSPGDQPEYRETGEAEDLSPWAGFLPVAIGLTPLLFQNGIWMEDAVTGAAVALPARHSTLLDWSNFDATAFVIVDQLNSPAFGTDPHAAQAVGTAWFIEAYGGYIETGWAYLHDRRIYLDMLAGGFRNDLKEKILGNNAHVKIEPNTVGDMLKRVPGGLALSVTVMGTIL